jgi:hypothetical protein
MTADAAQKAVDMLSLFQSAGAQRFSVTLIDIDGHQPPKGALLSYAQSRPAGTGRPQPRRFRLVQNGAGMGHPSGHRWSEEEVAARLIQESEKAQQRRQKDGNDDYALQIVRSAAAAIDREGGKVQARLTEAVPLLTLELHDHSPQPRPGAPHRGSIAQRRVSQRR